MKIHNPEVVLGHAGWKIGLEEDDRLSGVQLLTDGKALMPAEYRRMIAQGNDYMQQHILFWHIVGGKVRPFDAEHWARNPNPHNGIPLSEEQFFVRISSPQSLDEIWDDPGIEMIMNALGDLCLWAP